jgi:tetratricopeptide (TPR) repeat protein
MYRGASIPFGELLASLRSRCHLTQMALAASLGIHRNTVGRWERGEVLPDSRGIVLELARLLELDEQETRQLLEASLTALAPYWTVPFPRNPSFTGREAILEQLHSLLSADPPAGALVSYALTGLGGIGKTHLAVEYAYRFALEYSAVLWIAADSAERMAASFLAIAEALHLPECHDIDQRQVSIAVQRWLTTHQKWLLIVDNIEDVEILQAVLPTARQGAILLTTQRQALGPLVERIDLPPMSQSEGVSLVLRRAKLPAPDAAQATPEQSGQQVPAGYAAAQQLVTLLGGLPLALDQAGAYIEETGCGVAQYLARYEQQRRQLLARRGTATADHPQSVLATFLIANQRIEQKQPLAAEILRLCAFLHPDAIPEELFLAELDKSGSPLPPGRADPYQLDLSLALLRTLSLIQRNPATQTISIHRLVQTVLREGMDEQERATWQRCVIRRLNQLFPTITYDTWRQCEQLLPHVVACAETIPDQVCDLDLAETLQKAADYLCHREHAEIRLAEAMYLRALRIQEQITGPEHLEIAVVLSELAYLYTRQGKYEQAESLYRRSLTIWERIPGPERPAMANTLMWFGFLSFEQGKYDQVEARYQRALQIWERTLGSQHHKIASVLDKLAMLYYRQGQYAQSESFHLRALAIQEHILGEMHPAVAHSLNGLAGLYYEQGKYELAEAFCLRALSIQEEILGPEHPYIANLVNNLGDLAMERAEYAKAEPLYQRALDILEQVWGSEHPDLAYPLNGLANLHRELARWDEAILLYQRSLRLREQFFGPSHPETAGTLHDFAVLYQKQGNLEEAASLYRRALAIQQQMLGEDHPKTVATRTSYAALFPERDEGDLSESRYFP